MTDIGSRPWTPRRVLPRLEEALADARAVVLHGPRQSGKTTIARRVVEDRGGTYLTLDDDAVRAVATSDPAALLLAQRPVVLDEFQLGGDRLIRAVKREVDREPGAGAN